MAEKKKSRAEKMYGDSPEMKRDEESGKMAVKKPSQSEKKSKEVEGGTEGAEREGMKDGAMPHHVRHAMGRNDMHARHEHEHSMHDHMKHGDKKEMHARHEKEMRTMHTRHEKESGEGMVEKTEANEKEGGE